MRKAQTAVRAARPPMSMSNTLFMSRRGLGRMRRCGGRGFHDESQIMENYRCSTCPSFGSMTVIDDREEKVEETKKEEEWKW